MKKIKALQTLQATGKKIFSSVDLQKILQIKDINYSHIFAAKLVKEGVIKRVMRGCYVLSSHEPSDFELANNLYAPSYISLDSALNYYGVLIQSPQQIISVTINSTKKMVIEGKMYSYLHLKQNYFTDYQKMNGFLIATPEKALIEAMFFTALGRSSLSLGELILDSIDKDKVRRLASKIENQAFKKYFRQSLNSAKL